MSFHLARTKLQPGCIAFLLALLFSAHAWAQSTTVVISQVYGGGGNTSATYDSDFIELFNLSSAPVSLNGWSVQYIAASSTSVNTQVTAIGNVTLQPGQFYLIKEATGTTCTATSPPCPSFTADNATQGTINLSGTNGKVFLVNSTTAITEATAASGTVTACPATPPAGAAIIDYVGFGSASCAEGAKAAPAPSGNTQSLVRTNPCTDTNNNGSDFSVSTTVTPRNTSTALAACGTTTSPTAPSLTAAISPATQTAGQAVLLTAAVKPGTSPASTALTVTADLSAFGGSATTPLNDAASNGDATANDGTYSANFTIPAAQAGGAYSLTFTVSDGQMRSSTGKAALTVTMPVTFVPIHTIQGSMGTGATAPAASSYVGSSVQTSGIVTGVLSNGFYLQARDSAADSDATTPEGIFVHTGTGAVPATATVGTEVQVSGTVALYPSGAGITLAGTELDNVTGLSVLSSGNTLPTAVQLTTMFPSPGGGPYQLMRYQSMRVSVAPSFTATEGTQGTLTETAGTYVSNGQFYGTVTGVARPVREPGLEVLDPLTATYPNITKFDDNPEVFAVDSLDMQGGTAGPINLASGAVLTNMTGVMDFSGALFSTGGGSGPQFGAGPVFMVDATSRPTVTGGMTVVPVPAAKAGELTIADQNMEHFYNATADTTGAVVLTAQAYALRLAKASLAIRNVLGTPDILCLEEVENLATLTDLSNKISTDAVAAGQADPAYVPYLVQGNDTAAINVAYLVKPSKVDVIDVTQFGKASTYMNSTGVQAVLNDRPPLVMHVGVKRAVATEYPLTIIVNHLRSLNGATDSSASGANVRLKREAQAEYLANLIQGYQANGEHVISVGDYNVFEFNDGIADSMDVIRGIPVPANQDIVAGPATPLVTPALVDLAPTNVGTGMYSYVFVGNAQSIDHFLASADIASLMHTSAAHYNADFPVIYRNDSTRPEANSDHDGIVGFLAVPPGTAVSVTPASLTYNTAQPVNTPSAAQAVTVNNTGTAALTFTSIATSTGFTQTNTCGATLAAGASCTINVVFQPVAPGPQTGTLTLTDSDATGTQTVALSGTGAGIFSAISLTASPAAAVAGAKVVLTATLSGNSTNLPSGTVTFNSNGTLIGTAMIASGVATLTTTTLPVGTDTITASYGGDTVYPAATTTTPVSVLITAAPVPGFSFSIANSFINVSDSAKSGTATLNVAFVNGFSQTVTFSCTNVPANTHCIFAPPTLSATGSSTLTVVIDKASLAPSPMNPLERNSGIVLAALWLPLLLRRPLRSKLRGCAVLLGMLLLGCAVAGISGCASDANTAKGSTVVTVNATSGSVTHSATFTLVVQ